MAGLTVRRAPYKDFLQPALQRRFASTATILLVVSYAEALVLASWNSFIWSWFPLGSAGFRTLFIFICGFAILVLRIANYHVGLRTIGSGCKTFQASLTKFSTYETALWYIFSSSLFCPVFLWSMPESANLSWVTYFSGDRARVNERTLFLASYLGYCALQQSIDHFKNDVDRLNLGIFGQKTTAAEPSTSLKRVLLQLPELLATSTKRAVFAYGVAFLIYFSVVRSFAWGWALMFLRPFYNLPKANLLPPSWPFDIFLIARCVFAGTLAFFMWSAANIAFSIFMVQEPLKNGQPLTSESKDPNGSLLNGLKSKKPSIQFFAMWELSRIAEGFDVRRSAIYTDIDRKEGPMWSQVYGVCMDVIKSIETRANDYGKPPVPAQPEPQLANPKPQVPSSLRNDPIFTKAVPGSGASKFATLIDQSAHALGSSAAHDGGASPLSKLSPIAKKTWANTKDNILTKEQQEAVSSEGIKSYVQNTTIQLMKNLTWIDLLLRHDFRTEFTGAVLGSPYAEPAFYSHAVNALSQLAVHSLGEDQFGNVHRDVPSIIRTFTSVIRSVEALKQRFPIHWTDAASDKQTPEVDQVLDSLRTGLDQVVKSFEPFSHDLRLTQGDLRLAKEAATKPEAAPSKPAEKSTEKSLEQVMEKTAQKQDLLRQASRRRQNRSETRTEMEQVKQR